MVRKILIMLLIAQPIFCQTYTITEEELAQLEATLETQREILTRQVIELSALKEEIETSKQSLIKATISFDEYETAALQIQSRLLSDNETYRKKLRGWQIALPITGAVALTGGLLIGIFAK